MTNSPSKVSPSKSVIPKTNANLSPSRKNTKDSTKSNEVSTSLTQPTFSNLLKSNTTQTKDIYADEVMGKLRKTTLEVLEEPDPPQ